MSDTNLPKLTWDTSAVVNLAAGHGQDGAGMVETIHDIIDASTYWRVVSEHGTFDWIEIAPKVGEDCEDMRVLVRHTVPTNKIRAYTSGVDDLYVGIHPNVGGAALVDHDAVDPWGGATGYAFSQYANAFHATAVSGVEDLMVIECEEALHILGLDTGGNLRHAFLGHLLDPRSSINGDDFYSETPAVYRKLALFSSEDKVAQNGFWNTGNDFLTYNNGANNHLCYTLRPDGVWAHMQRLEQTPFLTTTRNTDAGGREYSFPVSYFHINQTFAGVSRQWGTTNNMQGVVEQEVAAVLVRVQVGAHRSSDQHAMAHNNE